MQRNAATLDSIEGTIFEAGNYLIKLSAHLFFKVLVMVM